MMETQVHELKYLQKNGYKLSNEIDVEYTPTDSAETPSSTRNDVTIHSDDISMFADVDRGVWSNKLEFFLVIMGYTVGLGSVWRFPIICSRNGGGAFLIPFFFFLITSGGPLYYMEVCLGQFTGKSAGGAFAFCPLLKGLGLLQVTLSAIVLWYFMSILGWVFYFLYSSFHTTLPWTTCDNSWNTARCRDLSTLLEPYNANVTLANGTTNNMTSYNVARTNFSSSAYEFWEYHVIGRSSGLEDMGHVQPHLVLCQLVAWTFCTLAIINGTKTLGKVIYVTATAPFVLLTILLIKGLTLDGAMDGIMVYLTPDFSKLLTIQVWLDAAIQVFFSLGPTWGAVITMASYNKFHENTFWSTTLCVVTAGFSAFFNGLVVFTLLGFMAKQSGMTVQEVATQSGPGLAFVVFPTILSQMPLPQLWSVLFFLVLVTVGFDSLFGTLETVTSYLIDTFPKQLIPRRIPVNILTGVTFFLTSLPLTMNGGIYVFQLDDWYTSPFGLWVGSFLECVTVCWIYGTDRFATDIKMMTGRDVSAILRTTWTIIIPLSVLVVFIVVLTRYSTPAYGDGYVYSNGAICIGFLAGLIPIFAMIIVGANTLRRMNGSIIQRLRRSLHPSDDWYPNDRRAQAKYKEKPYVHPNSWWRRFVLSVRGSKQNPIF